ncbi:hypothetical protein BTO06_17125 [Tenacibaculum sp. SZ-18]|uniref:hypothetical protein n=1 Tax=Tenacibaculum sp. SZ-18 TaxID=754423 RepID=UPI000C2CE3CA|nr:hypothetical protein [Tenacibaculum sp. SZ-18]AUC16759.1 hypothetical protein BTO06_17125 [Tenacibaculum sp. SZ-18]
MSQLDTYISKLLKNNDALEAFIKNPKEQSKQNGLSKADGAILRRSVSGLPATAKTGLGISRPLSSYRSSIRLLQNVLHNYHGHKIAGYADNDIVYLPTILIYYNDIPNWKGAPVNDPHQAYTNHVYALYKNNNTSAATLGEAMGFVPLDNPSVGDKVTGSLDIFGNSGYVNYTATYYNMGKTNTLMPYITEFNINGTIITIDLEGVTPEDHLPFWFYSLNGNAIVPNDSDIEYHKNPDAIIGKDFYSFADYPLPKQSDIPNTITWQAIAPDTAYGFASCHY